MSEQRLVTYHGGPLDGRMEAWEAAQEERRFTPMWIPMVGSFGAYGVYRETEPGEAMWESHRDPIADVPSSNDILIPKRRRPWWRIW